MHHKILKHLLSLFFVLMLPSVLGSQREEKTVKSEKDGQREENLQKNGQHKINTKRQPEIKIY